jgi:lactonase
MTTGHLPPHPVLGFVRHVGGRSGSRQVPVRSASAPPPSTTVASGHTGMHINGGGAAQTGSNAVDAARNVYQGMHGQPEVLVYGPDGTHRVRITVPARDKGREPATSIAIRPGATEAYATVSGPAGGCVYRFEARSPKGVRQSNGG